MVVLIIRADQVAPASMEVCQPVTAPVWPLKVIVPLEFKQPVDTFTGATAPVMARLPPTEVALVLTTWVVVTGPLQPAALAVMVVVPLQPAAYVTAPVDELILLPAKAKVVASRLYTMAAELLLAVVVVITVPAPWQRVEVAGEKAAIVTDGVTVTT